LNDKYKLKFLLCCHLPLRLTLGGAKVYLEAAEVYRKLGHHVVLVGIDELVGIDSPYMDENWRVKYFPEILKSYILEYGGSYDVIEYESIYLPFNLKESVKAILVARSVLLDLHLREIKIPRFRGLKAIAGYLLKGMSRNRNLNKKINQSLLTIAYADFVNVPNQSDKDVLLRNKIEDEKIIVQPYGIFLERQKQFAQIREAMIIPLTIKKIAFVGTFDNRKGAVEFPEIINIILNQFPDVAFKFLGVLGMFPSEESIKKHIGGEFLDRVQVIGNYNPEQLPELLKDCSFGIFPSYLESFGYGVLEMMAMGLPVVGYNSPGVSSLLLSDLMLSAGDKNGIIKKLTELVANEKLTREYSQKSILKASEFIYENQENQSIKSYLMKLGKID
jgi:glycosyltransferase involved in cell wall biosynthesis